MKTNKQKQEMKKETSIMEQEAKPLVLKVDNKISFRRFEDALYEDTKPVFIKFKYDDINDIFYSEILAKYIYQQKTDKITLYLNKKIFDYMMGVISLREIEVVKDIDSEIYENSSIGENIKSVLDIFKYEYEQGHKLVVKDDFRTSKGEYYYCADFTAHKITVNYCLKKTPELLQFLEEKGL